jgi:hypothetical protein
MGETNGEEAETHGAAMSRRTPPIVIDVSTLECKGDRCKCNNCGKWRPMLYIVLVRGLTAIECPSCAFSKTPRSKR